MNTSAFDQAERAWRGGRRIVAPPALEPVDPDLAAARAAGEAFGRALVGQLRAAAPAPHVCRKPARSRGVLVALAVVFVLALAICAV
jgi:hypothetical protein